MTNSETTGKPSANDADFAISTSDDGVNWSVPTKFQTGTSLPGLVALDDETFLVVWGTSEGAVSGELVSRSFKLTETALAPAGP